MAYESSLALRLVRIDFPAGGDGRPPHHRAGLRAVATPWPRSCSRCCWLPAAVAVALILSKPSLSVDSSALAKVGMPLGGGTIQSVSVVTGPHSRPVAVDLKGHQLWPNGQNAGRQPGVDPGRDQAAGMGVVADRQDEAIAADADYADRGRASPLRDALKNAPLRVGFTQPVASVSYGPNSGQLRTRALRRSAEQGDAFPTAAPGGLGVDRRGSARWETAKAAAGQLVPRRLGRFCGGLSGARHDDQAQHADHAHVLQADQQGARQRDARRLSVDRRAAGTSSTATGSCSDRRATATASAPT